ncbi:MAG: SDR family oxidoreductase, partial [Anaerolineae bacterium]|nr:SDR family oxidoreductase [Anaerolineae bacterium]
MIIETGRLPRDTLKGQAAIITGGGRGIGFETARALIWLGCRVVLAEIDQTGGKAAEQRLNAEFGAGSAVFIRTDVGRYRDVIRLKRRVLQLHGQVDIVVNNATITPMGAVKDVAITDWDASYRVNLRGPVLLARAFLPDMLERDYGVFVCVSSVGDAYMGAYETFKAAQVHLANTLDAELEGTGVHAFTIGPGLVRTPGAQAGIAQLAPLYGKTVEAFYAMSEAHIISAEAAGAGFAAAVALASEFRGQEISAKQALIAAGIVTADRPGKCVALSDDQVAQALDLSRRIHQTLREQSEGWRERSLFERQWMYRDFKKAAGATVEQWLETLAQLERALDEGQFMMARTNPPLARLEAYYA